MPEKRYVVGFDLGGTKMIATVFDGKMNPLESVRSKTPGDGDGESTKEAMIELLRETLLKSGIDKNDVSALGVAVPGPVSVNRKTVIKTTNLGMLDYPLAGELETALDIETWLENDVRSGVYGELKYGALKGYSSAVGIFIGTGIGGGVVMNGEIWRGSSGCAGEVGHLVLMENGPLCGCGNYGCLEALASRSAMAKDAVFAASSGKAPSVFERVGTDFRKYKSGVFEEALDADEKEIVRIIDRSALHVGIACASIVHLLNPEAILLGGGLVSRIGEYYRKKVRESFDSHVMQEMKGSMKLLVTALRDQAVPLGAALFAKETAGRR